MSDDEEIIPIEALDRVTPTLPEHLLLIHIVYRSVLDLGPGTWTEAEDREDAREWFRIPWLKSSGRSRELLDYGSFQYCCQHLAESDPEGLGQAILKELKARRLL